MSQNPCLAVLLGAVVMLSGCAGVGPGGDVLDRPGGTTSEVSIVNDRASAYETTVWTVPDSPTTVEVTFRNGTAVNRSLDAASPDALAFATGPGEIVGIEPAAGTNSPKSFHVSPGSNGTVTVRGNSTDGTTLVVVRESPEDSATEPPVVYATAVECVDQRSTLIRVEIQLHGNGHSESSNCNE